MIPLQALSSESSEQKEFEEAVRSELTENERRCIEEEQLKQKAVTEKDLVSCIFWLDGWASKVKCCVVLLIIQMCKFKLDSVLNFINTGWLLCIVGKKLEHAFL